jgi:hypothetical protein
VNTVPISANRAINRFALVRNLGTGITNKAFNLGAWDRFAHAAMIRWDALPPPKKKQQKNK